MTLVTVAEARANLLDLLGRAAAGEQIVITEDGQWLAMLGKPPLPFKLVIDEAERRQMLEEFERNIARWHEEDGLPYPPQATPQEPPLPESPAA
jgi:antitoxin (DNA-binding transcriptional repressor) of toxin-antitoxin stability system